MSPPQETDPSLRGLDPLPGRIIAGNFRIEQLIGQGAMGNVYRAEQLSLGKAVAVKVLHPHLMDDEKLVGRFKREAKSASKLNHPNTIQIIDSGQDRDGTLYIAMELLAGRDLAQVIRDDFPMPLPRVVRIMSQVMSALDEAHAHGVIHRDLKPSNIMLIERRGEQDFVKVCDYGIAKATSPDGKDQEEDRQQMLTIQGLVCGTPEYMSPEQARAEPLDGRADLYSAAIILYQLVTGDIPFRADSPMGIVSRHLAEVPRAPSSRRADLPIPKAMDELILRGMEKNRELRYPNALAFRAALEGIVTSSTGQLTPFGVQTAMPTIPSARPGATALIPPMPAADKFGTTADLSGAAARARRRRTSSVLAGLLLVGAAAVAFKLTNGGGPSQTDGAALAGAISTPAPAAPSPVAPAVVAAEPPAPPPLEPAPAAEVAPAAAPPEELKPPAIVTNAAIATTKTHAKRQHHQERAHQPVAIPAAPPEPPPATVAKAAAPVDAPPTRGAREVLGEAEKLLGQGEVSDACARGEEAKRLGPKQAPVFKFLGKCYMRAGHAPQARENYQRYLELAPTASDAPFIKSMLK